MFSKKIAVLLGIIIVFGFLIRIVNLSSIPPGLNRDEASIGYTAYSIMQTGRDEHGVLFPLSVQSFGDWKLPGYIYIAIPSIAFFGLNEFATRLPSAFFASISLLFTYILVYKLFYPYVRQNKLRTIALLASFLLAISPWHFFQSRVSSESLVANVFLQLGIICFLISLEKRNFYLILALLFFGLTLYIYHAYHIFTPLFVSGLGILYWKKLIQNKYLIVSASLFAVITGIIFYKTVLGADATKINGLHVLSDPSYVYNEIVIPRTRANSSLMSKIFYNKFVVLFDQTIRSYIRSYSPDFLFIKGGTNSQHNIQGFGNLHAWQIVPLIIGFVYLLFHKSSDKKLILLWLLLSAVPASITKDAPHTARMFSVVPLFEMITALGIYFLATKFFHQKLYRLIICFESVVATFFLTAAIWFFLNKKFSHTFFGLILCILSMYTYNATRFTAPLIGLYGVYSVFGNYSIKQRASILGICLLGSLPLVLSMISGSLTARFNQTGIIAIDSTLSSNAQLQKMSIEFISNILSYVSIDFLFFRGDGIGRHTTAEVGLLYPYEFFTIIIGLYTLFRNKILSKNSTRLILLWFSSVVIVAALNRPSPHMLRTLPVIFPVSLVSAYGMYTLYIYVKQFSFRIIASIVLVGICLYSVSYQQMVYWGAYRNTRAIDWVSFDKDLYTYIKPFYKQYNRIYISNWYLPSYISALYYLRIDPRELLQDHAHSFGNFVFSNNPETIEHQSLLIMPPNVVNDVSLTKKHVISLKNGDSMYEIYEKP